MPQRVLLSEALRDLTNGEESVEVNAATVNDAIVELQRRFPGITKLVLDEKAGIRRFPNIYVNDEDIRFLQSRDTLLNDGDRISIVLAGIDARTAVTVIDVAERLKMSQKI